MNKNMEILSQISKYCTLIHSVPGRLRVRVKPQIKELKKSLDLAQMDQIIKKIDGINDVKFNNLIGSLTISYDNAKFPQQLWHDLLNNENLEQISQKIDEIKGNFSAK